MHERFVKALLHDVLSILSVAGYSESYREKLCFVSMHQKFECSALAILCGGNLHCVRLFPKHSGPLLTFHRSLPSVKTPGVYPTSSCFPARLSLCRNSLSVALPC